MISNLVAAAGAALALATASPASGGPATDPVRLTVSPATVVVASGQHRFAETVTVTDSGRDPLRVAATVRMVRIPKPHTCLTNQPVPWASIYPSGFDLTPGQSATATFTLSAPASLGGRQDVAALFEAAPGTTGNARVAGVVDSRVILRLNPKDGSLAVPPCGSKPKPNAAPRHVAITRASDSLPVVVGIGLLAAALLLALGWLMGRRRRTT